MKTTTTNRIKHLLLGSLLASSCLSAQATPFDIYEMNGWLNATNLNGGFSGLDQEILVNQGIGGVSSFGLGFEDIATQFTNNLTLDGDFHVTGGSVSWHIVQGTILNLPLVPLGATRARGSD
jgi:hypothetical protein